MAQDVSRGSYEYKQRLKAKSLAVTVPVGSNAELLNFVVGDVSRVFCTLENTGADALDAFVISAKAHEDDDWVELYAAAAAFATPTGILIGVSTTNPFTLAGAGRSWFILDTMGLYALKLEASANGNPTTMDVFMSGNGH